jgi:hypothetical protein
MRRLILVLVVTFSFITGSMAHAQNSPLLLTVRGDIYAAQNGSLEQRTTWGRNEAPILAPNGAKIAYKSTAALVVDAEKRFGVPGMQGELPSNIWILDVATNQGKRVADQPPDASIFNPNVPDYYLIRSDPSWSPDGSALAWTELVMHGGNPASNRLVTYTLATGQTSTLVELLPMGAFYEGATSAPVRWGPGGLAVAKLDVVMDAQAGLSVNAIYYIYSDGGKLLVTSETVPVNYIDFAWITDDTTPYLIAAYTPYPSIDGLAMTLIDTATGKMLPLTGLPELYSLTTPNGITLRPPLADGTSVPVAGWELRRGEMVVGTVNDLNKPDSYRFSFGQKFAISPDGATIAFIDAKGGVVINSGNAETGLVGVTDAVRGLAWGPIGWRIAQGAAAGG